MENPKDQLIERIKSANNVLVTVSSNPSVDQLSAAIGLTLTLNKMDKHATAVYSGSTPSTIEFLKPEKTIEKNTDSLRDFIIALDKTKADKLRYKVEQDHVKIFITPYRTSISEKDLEFSQGDFNVDVVVALGVTDQKDLDQAITAHGRILHDATTISVTTGAQSNLGSINWADSNASSLCEMVVGIADALQSDILDGQIATALMTGIVAETDRFSNDKTSSSAMSASAKLMSAGANQQLVASELQEKPAEPELSDKLDETEGEFSPADTENNDDSFQIDHESEEDQPAEEQPDQQDWQSYEPFTSELPDVQSDDVTEEAPAEEEQTPEPEPEHTPEPEEVPQDSSSDTTSEPVMELSEENVEEEAETPLALPEVPEPAPSEPEAPIELSPAKAEGIEDLPPAEPEMPASEPITESPSEPTDPVTAATLQGGGSVVFDPPTRGGTLTANTEPEDLDPAVDPLAGGGYDSPILNHDEPADETPATEPKEEIPAPSMTLPSEAATTPAWEMPAQTQPTPQPADAAMPPFNPMMPPPPIEAMPPTVDVMPAAESTAADTSSNSDLDNARDAVAAAVAGAQQPLPPIEALNATPLDLEIKQTGETGILDHTPEAQTDASFELPENLVPQVDDLPADPTATDVSDPVAPPPVPPPLMPPNFGNAPLPPMPGQAGDDQQAPVNNNPQNPFNLPPA